MPFGTRFIAETLYASRNKHIHPLLNAGQTKFQW